MKIFFNRKIRTSPWGGGSIFLTDFSNYLQKQGHEIVFSLVQEIDVLFMLDPRPEEGGYDWTQLAMYKMTNPGCKLVHRINECDKRNDSANNIDELLIKANKHADTSIFISTWLKNYFKGKITKNVHVVYNGCDTNIFKPDEYDRFLKPIRLCTHHWSNNVRKGADFYKEIDELCSRDNRYQFTYIGRHPISYQPKATKVIAPLYGKELGDELRKHDIYVTASRFEPCGMHHIEGAASGLPVLYHRDGGGIVECCRKHGIEFHDTSSMIKGIETLAENYIHYRSIINYPELSSEHCCKQYCKLLEELLK